MIVIPSVPFIAQKKKTPASPAVPLALVSAAYDPEVPGVTLTFNKAIDTGEMLVDSIVVADGQFNNASFIGTTTTGVTATSVTIEMVSFGPAELGEVTLTADAANGIVAASGGEVWEGVSGVALPFP